MGANIRDHCTVGKNTIIGMGSTVIKNVPDNMIAIGTPAKFYKK